MPHPAARILDVACVARNKMDMHMRHGLPCRRAHVDSHIEAIRVKALGKQAFQPVNHQPQGGFGVGGKFEVIGDMFLGDDQRR